MVKQNIEHHDIINDLDNIPKSSYSVRASYKIEDPGEEDVIVVNCEDARLTVYENADYQIVFDDKSAFGGKMLKGNFTERCELIEKLVECSPGCDIFRFLLMTRLDNYILDGSVSIITIDFDYNSSAAAKNFKDRFEYVKDLKYVQVNHKLSDNVQYRGYFNVKSEKLTGTGFELYDSTMAKNRVIKYEGKFEDGDYAGGTFKSRCGNIEVFAPNICNGKPNGMGQLRVGETFKQDFRWKDTIDTGVHLNEYGDSLCESILKKLHCDADELLCKVSFDTLTMKEQLDKLYQMCAQNEDDIFDNIIRVKNQFGNIWYYVHFLLIAVYLILVPLIALVTTSGSALSEFSLPLGVVGVYMIVIGPMAFCHLNKQTSRQKKIKKMNCSQNRSLL
jgi:hypothetical protein